MDDRVKALSGGNLDVDLSSDVIDWKQTQCPWNVADNTYEHKCAVKGTSICKYFCGIKFLDSVLCSYPYENSEVLTRDDMDRDMW